MSANTAAARRRLRQVFPAVLAFVLALSMLLLAMGTIRIGDGTTFMDPLHVSSLPSAQQQVGDGPPLGSETVSWYESRWLIGASAVGVLVILFLGVRWRTAYLEHRSQRLENLVSKRTREVERQKEQLQTYNQELLRTNEALRQTVEENSRLLGMAAHDLKNPLFGIRALSEIVLESGELSEKNDRKVNLIHDSASEAIHLIEDLLASAASASHRESDFEPVDVSALSQWVVRSFEPQAERKDQTVRCQVSANRPCVVEGDKRKLREAINNLVSNALKYSPPGEDVELLVDRQDGQVRVDVIDAGPGLSEADQRRMFAPFQRLSPEPTGGEGSSGLGLYIVKQIAEMHDGTVEVDTEVGEGSTFSLVLPRAEGEEATLREAEPETMELEDTA